jgi:hypothetical protein
MPYPGQIFEDPMYDEDGNLVDEDYDLEELEKELTTEYDPFDTINS